MNIRGVTVHVFVPSRHGTGTSERLQRCTAVRKCGVHSGQRSSNSRNHVEYQIMNVTIVIYYTALLNAVERSVDLHGPSQLPVVNSVLGC